MSYKQLALLDWDYSAMWDEESAYSHFGMSAVL